MGRILRYTIAGMLGAVIAWAVMEPTSLMPDDARRLSFGANFAIGCIAGFIIGLFMGVAEALSCASPRDGLKTIISGALIGAAGGVLGLSIGNAVYSFMESLAGGRPALQHLPQNLPPEAQMPSEANGGFLSFLLLLIGRGFGWALLGTFIGLSQGIGTSNTKKMVNGAVGGFIGGGIGGSVFETLKWMNMSGAVAFQPAMLRFISFAITGGAIGLFISFVAEIRKRAWLVKLVGRNEGKEYELYNQVTVLGRSEYVDIPIYTDADVAERHASISALGNRYSIEDLGSAWGTTVNGKKLSAKEPLRDGDTIVVGKTRFLFRDKATASTVSRDPVSYAGVKIPTSDHVCPFCGAVKDANGRCDCTVNGSPSPNIPAAPTVSQPTMQSTQAFSGQNSDPQNIQFAPPPSVISNGAKCVALSGPLAGQTFILKDGETQIGRDSTKDIGLSMDNTVSRNHAMISLEGGNYILYDTGSTNGTFVNAAKITRHQLSNGDMIQIGSTKFRFEM